MENQLIMKAPIDRAEYARNYQRMRYANDTEIKSNQLIHVKKLYRKNKELLETYKG